MFLGKARCYLLDSKKGREHMNEIAREIREYCKARVKAEQAYAKRVELLKKQYPGTPYAQEETAKAQAALEETLRKMRVATWAACAEPVMAFHNRYESRKAKAPTQEQLNALQVLGMRKHVSAGELQEVLNLCGDCPLTWPLLKEIAQKHGFSYVEPFTARPQIAWLEDRESDFTYRLRKIVNGESPNIVSRFTTADDNAIIAYMFGVPADIKSGGINQEALTALMQEYARKADGEKAGSIEKPAPFTEPKEEQHQSGTVWENNGL